MSRFGRHSLTTTTPRKTKSATDLIRELQYGAAPATHGPELWRRIVFSILISNTDDHLRNHGSLYEGQKGWRLSPVYDVNPVPVEVKERILTTASSENDGTASLDLALSVTGEFGLKKKEASPPPSPAGVKPLRGRYRKSGDRAHGVCFRA